MNRIIEHGFLFLVSFVHCAHDTYFRELNYIEDFPVLAHCHFTNSLPPTQYTPHRNGRLDSILEDSLVYSEVLILQIYRYAHALQYHCHSGCGHFIARNSLNKVHHTQAKKYYALMKGRRKQKSMPINIGKSLQSIFRWEK